jgi:hypothetical protein
MDNIDPYTFDTAAVFVQTPYKQLLAAEPGGTDALQTLMALPEADRQAAIAALSDYYGQTSPTPPRYRRGPPLM